MTVQQPVLDTRKADDVVSEIEQALLKPPIEWQGVEGGAGYALVRLFGRLSELVITRLNQVPENHFREFLNKAGINLLPPRNASVDLSFTPFADGPDVVFVLAGTQANTQPSASLPDELIFETLKDLNVLNNKLGHCIAFDPNFWADRTIEATGVVDEDFPAFEGRKEMERERILYIGDRKLFAFEDDSARQASTITLTFEFDQPLKDSAERWRLEWLYWDWDEDKKVGKWQPMPKEVFGEKVDEGEVDKVFRATGKVTLKGIPKIVESSVGGIMFSIGNHLVTDLDRGMLPSKLREAFRNYGASLAQNATLATVKAGETWQITSDTVTYKIVNSGVLTIFLDPVTAPWIECKLRGDVATAILPVIRSIKATRKIEFHTCQVARDSVALSALQANTAFVAIPNLSDEFYPFGQVPGRLDTFYLSSDEAFSKPGAVVQIELAHLEGIPQDVHTWTEDTEKERRKERRKDIDELKIVWEYSSTEGWKELGTSALLTYRASQVAGNPVEPGKAPIKVPFTDATCAFTGYGNPPHQYIEFNVPNNFKKAKVADKEGYWVRARIVAGSYTLRANLDVTSLLGSHVFYEAKTYAPLIRDLKVTYFGYNGGTEESEDTLCRGSVDSAYRDHSAVWKANEAAAVFTARELGPALYLGFDRAFPNRTWVSLLLDVVEEEGASESQETISWQYWDGSQWSALEATDASRGLTIRGYLGFYARADHQPSVEFGQSAYWLRARSAAWRAHAGYRVEPRNAPESPLYFLEASGTGTWSPAGRPVVSYEWRLVKSKDGEAPDAKVASRQRLKTISMNVVQAANQATIADEVLGSSDGKKGQVFPLARAPVVETSVILAVREPDWPPQDELDALKKELAASEEDPEPKLTPPRVPDQTGWVRWRQVLHFYDSGKDSRHFVLDPYSGKVRFGDGDRGKIPPAGRDNIRAVRYCAHNGVAGNVQAGAIAILRNPSGDLAEIRSVANHAEAVGGSVENVAKAEQRGPQTLKHRSRAVTKEGYGWLAQETGSHVERAYGLLTRDSEGRPMPGQVTVVVVPTAEEKVVEPKPTPALLRDVRGYLNERALANLVVEPGQITVKGPDYVRVKVSARVIPKHPEKSDQVLVDIAKSLRTFLHPLRGGPDGSGWGFGRDVYLSEIAAVLEAVEGVDHVSKMHLSASQFQSRLVLTKQIVIPYDLPARSQVSTFDDRTKLVLVESVYQSEPDKGNAESSRSSPSAIGITVDRSMTGDPRSGQVDARSLFVVGFKIGDEVLIVADDGRVLKDDLTISYLAAVTTRITFDKPDGLTLPADWTGALRSVDDRTQVCLLEKVEVQSEMQDEKKVDVLTGLSVKKATADNEPSERTVERVGFRTGDQVIVFDKDDQVVWPDHLTIKRVADEVIRVDFELPFSPGSWPDWKRLYLRSKNGLPIQLPLSGPLRKDDKSNEVVVAVTVQNLVKGDRVSVVVDGRRHPNLELLTIEAIDRRDDRIFVPEPFLVSSDNHDIRMALE